MTAFQIGLHEGLRTTATQVASGNTFASDAPKIIGGLEEEMGPTDYFAASLGCCILVMMGAKAKKLGVDLTGATCDLTKEMAYKPNRVRRLSAKVRVPITVSDEHREMIELAARECPIHHSLHPDIEQEMTFEWGA